MQLTNMMTTRSEEAVANAPALDADDASTTSSCLESDPYPLHVQEQDGDILDDIIRSRIEKRTTQHGSAGLLVAGGIVSLYGLVIRKICQGDFGGVFGPSEL